MAIPTEPIGSIPRPPALIEAARGLRSGRISEAELLLHCDSAIQDTIARFEATGSKVVTDGEQAKESFATYPIHGLTNIAADGTPIPFADGHIRQFPRLSAGPFKYRTPADVYLEPARRLARRVGIEMIVARIELGWVGIPLAHHFGLAHHRRRLRAGVVDEDAVALFELVAQEIPRLVIAHAAPAGGAPGGLPQIVERKGRRLGLEEPVPHHLPFLAILFAAGAGAAALGFQAWSFSQSSSSSMEKSR